MTSEPAVSASSTHRSRGTGRRIGLQRFFARKFTKPDGSSVRSTSDSSLGCAPISRCHSTINLRNDSRVLLLEKTNIRYLDKRRLPYAAELATIDVSFISLTLVLPRIKTLLAPVHEIIALIKPQFEVGKGKVGKGGVVRSPEERMRVISQIQDAAIGLGYQVHGLVESLDSNSSYMTADAYKAFKAHKTESKGEIGAVVSKRFGYADVVSVLPGSPAENNQPNHSLQPPWPGRQCATRSCSRATATAIARTRDPRQSCPERQDCRGRASAPAR